MNLLRFATATAVVALATASGAQTYHVVNHWKIGGEGGWDYLLSDASSNRLYITHNAHVEVVDTKTGKLIGSISGLKGTHGIVLPPHSEKGYISDGGANAVVVFDRKTLAITATIPAGTNPDGMAYEPTTNTVWAFNGRSKNASVIDAATQTVVATVALPGKPEFPRADGDGFVYVNIEDKNEIVRLDVKAHTITAEWPLKGCESPSGMAIDKQAHRLFSVCDGGKMSILDYKTGKLQGLASIGDSPDAADFDAKSKLAFSSNGDGTMSVVATDKAGFPTIQTVTTQKGARTMAFDETTGTAYVVSAKYGDTPAATAKTPHPRPAVLPDTFEVLVIAK